MKKIIILTITLSFIQVNSQTYQLEYNCKKDFNDEQYKFIQRFDKEKYSYTIEQKERGFWGAPDKIYTVQVQLDPETLKYEFVKFPQGKDYFLSYLDWYNSISKDINWEMQFIFNKSNKKKESTIQYNSISRKVTIEEYVLQNFEKTQDFYKVYFISDDIIPIPMVYNKKNFLVEWTSMFYAYKNSHIKDILYSFENSDDLNHEECKLYKIQEIPKF